MMPKLEGGFCLRILTIINPSSGRQYFQYNARQIIKQLLADGIASHAEIIDTKRKGDAYLAARDFAPGSVDLVFAAGGDGTVNEVINGLIDGKHDVPLAIMAAGTANDFAFSMKLPKGVKAYCSMIRRFKTRRVDIGRIGGTCFLNVAAAGILTDISFKVTSEAKTVFGMFAYLLSGAIDLSTQIDRFLPITIRTEQKTIEDDILLFIITNTSSVGGFRNVAPHADPGDGLLDLIVVHRQSFRDVVPLFVQMASGEHLNSSKVSYFQTSHLEISCRDDHPVQLDLDGEPGPSLPVTIEVIPSAICILVP
jgi:diacylglycerol kinase (ATP)